MVEALLLIIIVILLAQFMPEVLYLGVISGVVIGGIVVAAIAGFLLWQTLGPDNLQLIIGGAVMSWLAFLGVRGLYRRIVEQYQLPLADPPIDPNSEQPLRSPRYVGKVATSVVAIIAGLMLGGILMAIAMGIASEWLTYDQKQFVEKASGVLLLITPILLYFWFRDLYTRREKHYWWRQNAEVIREETERTTKEPGTINMDNHVPSPGLDEYLARRDKSPVDAG